MAFVKKFVKKLAFEKKLLRSSRKINRATEPLRGKLAVEDLAFEKVFGICKELAFEKYLEFVKKFVKNLAFEKKFVKYLAFEKKLANVKKKLTDEPLLEGNYQLREETIHGGATLGFRKVTL